MKSNTVPTPKPGNQLWGIYYKDRNDAQEQGNPIRTVIEASTQLVAEEEAARLGFGNPVAQVVTPHQASQAQWLPMIRKGHRQELARKPSRGFRI